MADPLIAFRDVHKAFDHPVLDGVSLEVHEGETVSILGPSGTGKSVLLKTSIGLISVDSGDVIVDGESVLNGAKALKGIRSKVGYVFQYAALFDSMTVYENVALGIQDDQARELGPAEVRKRIETALEGVNLDPAAVLTKLPSELSGGMRKRVGLARATVGRPRILFYDEPVTGLDPVNTAAVSLLIGKIRDAYGVTSLVVTHDVEQALEISDRVVLLDHGKLRFVGTPQEFRTNTDPLVHAFGDRKAASVLAAQQQEEA
jgi:phospholipid/cholesterol/gamma-HCH transport system ATP-binding protein